MVDFTKCDLCFVRIKSAFEMNNIQRRDVTLRDMPVAGEITIRQPNVGVSEREVFC